MKTSPRWLQSILFVIAASFLLALAACGAGGGGGGGGGEVTTPVGDKPTVVAATPFAVSDSCPNGGVHVDWGIDANGNGVLDPTEITGGGDICNGAAGSNGQPVLVMTTPFSGAGGSCTAGGVLVEMGVDADLDGNLIDEVTAQAYICNGANGFSSLVVTSIESPGANCAYGGMRIRSGLDSNGNGSLDDESSGVVTSYVCNIGSMPLIQVRGSDVPYWSLPTQALGISTWDRIDGWYDDEVLGKVWYTYDDPSFFYSPYILVNNSDETRSVDVIGIWPTVGRYGNLTAYAYPFNPLQPTQPAPLDWNTWNWVDNDGFDLYEDINIIPITLEPHQSVVVVTALDNPGYLSGATYDLTFVSYTPIDASSGLGAAAGQLDVNAMYVYKATGLLPFGEGPPNFGEAPAPARVRVANVQDIVNMSVWQTPYNLFVDWHEPWCIMTGAQEYQACLLPYADPTGNLWIEVDASGAESGGTFDLLVEYPTDQGSLAVPVALGMNGYGDYPLQSSVGLGTSYYAITGLTLGATYTIQVGGAGLNDQSLFPVGNVTVTATETGATAPVSNDNSGLTTDLTVTVDVTLTDGTGLLIEVIGNSTAHGAFYGILVYPNP